MSACILFSSSPCFSFFLRCLLGLPWATTSCKNTYIEYGWTSYICQWLPQIWQLVGGTHSVNFKQHSSKTGQFGKPMPFHTSDPKVLDALFFLGVRLSSVLFLPLPFLFSWMLVWAATTYQLQKPIHRMWINIVHLSMIALKFGSSLRGPFCELQTAFFESKVKSKTGQFGKPNKAVPEAALRKDVHLCPSMLQNGYDLIIQRKQKKKNNVFLIFQNSKNIVCILLGYSMHTLF